MQVALEKTKDTNVALREFLLRNQLQPVIQEEPSVDLLPESQPSQPVVNIPTPFITQQTHPMVESSRQRNIYDLAVLRANTRATQDDDSVADYHIREMVSELFSKGYDNDQVEQSIF
jgi:hypothetical protein